MPSKHKKTEKSNTEEAGGTDNVPQEPPANADQTSAEATVPTNTDIMEAIAKLSGSFNKKFDDLSSTLIEYPSLTLLPEWQRLKRQQKFTKPASSHWRNGVHTWCPNVENLRKKPAT